ncbi:SDR family NAD(P)-dependent oxidoreductase [Streptomyces niveus]|uniref:SDR family NAD(P)-dependent oxidoreductase n=1 Tax=Streptomyces niveus TaxID=193462 RepID=UPI00344C053D
MISGMNRRDILERVRTGELSVTDAVTLMRADGDDGTEVVAYRAGWQRAEPAGAPPSSPGTRPLVVLDPAAAELPGLLATKGARVLRAVTGRTGSPDGSALPVGDDTEWERLWDRLDAEGETPRQVVVVTADGPERCLDAVYPVVRTLIRRRGGGPVAIACVAVGERGAESADALGGFCSIAALEDGRLRPVALSAVGLADPVEAALRELALPDAPLRQVRVDADGRWVRTLTATELAVHAGPDALGGVHLVSGGGGGIALRLAEELAFGAGARLVLLGRSAPGAGVDDLVRRVRDAGSGGVRYVQGDVTRPDDVRRAVAQAHRAFGPVTDVLHLAGVNEDAYIVNKAPGAHARVLAPKLAGARALDEATRDEPLRHFTLFSSLAGYAGHPGQADYAAAGRALGGFAVRRAELVAAGSRRGRTVSVGWPLWADGGMTLSDTDRRAVEALQGVVAMPPRTGLSVLAAARRVDAPEIVVVHGHRARIEKFVRDRLASPAPAPSAARADATVGHPSGPGGGALTGTARDLLLGEVSRLTRMKPGRLRPDQEFSALGIDSVMVKRLGTALEDRLGPMPATLLFDHRTVDDLAAYLVSHHGPALAASARASEPSADADADADPDPDASRTWPSSTARSAPAGEGIRSGAGAPDDAIAVIGIAGRYPGARDIDELWQMLVEGRDAITEIPADRWDKARWTDRGERLPGTSYGRWGGFLDDMARFDSLFFSVAPREARRMDPAERLFLEVAWTALEDAGYTRDRLHHATRTDDGHAVGVFAGTTGLAYGLVGAEQWGRGNPVPAYSMEFSLANRLSWFLDVHGPSLAVDTACSASLTALHLACESLRHGECRMAIAGGAYLNLHPMKFGMLAEQRMMSPDGVCRAFGEGGNGLVPGEGVGAVVLKPLAAARADGDRVDAVIRATAISHGGRTNGYTVPSPKAHAAVIGSALRRSGVDPDTISCVEAHGTGTELGDPIEIEGLARVFGRSAERRAPVALGSLKPNIGHAEAAAGIAGLTKLVLQIRHRTLAPTLHSDPPNSRIDFEATPFRLQRTAEPWLVPGGGLRRAALSSFGAGGANAHAVIEECPAARPDTGKGQPPDGERLIPLSARTPDRLTAAAGRLAAFLTAPRGADVTLTDIAHTLRTGREDFEYRAAFVVRTREDLRTALLSYVATGAATATGRVLAETPPRPAAGPHDPADPRDSAARWVRGEETAHTAADRLPTAHGTPRVVSLPGYPFSGPVHWPATAPPPSVSTPPPAGSPLAERAATGPGSAEYAVTLTPGHPWVADHLVDGAPVLAGTAHLELARAAAQLSTGGPVTELAGLRWRVPLVVAPDTSSAVRTRRDAGTVHIETVTGSADRTVVHATARAVLPDDTAPAAGPPDPLDIESVRARCARDIDGAAFYRGAAARGLVYGPSYRRVARLWCGDGVSLAELSSCGPEEERGGTTDPGLTDAALHAVHGAVPDWDEPATRPAAAELVRIHDGRTAPHYAVAELVTADPASGSVVCDVRTTDADGRVLVEITGLTVLRPSATDVPYLVPVWRVEPRSDVDTVPAATGPALILTGGHDAGVGAALARRHGADGTVDTISLTTADAYRTLLEGCSPGTTVYFTGGVDTRRHSATDLDHLQDTQRRGCLSLFHLARSLTDLRPVGIRLVVLTSDSHPLPGHPVENPFAGSLHGMARTLSRELPSLDVVCVDLGRADLQRCAEQGDFSALVAAVAAERKTVPLAEVALRQGTRLVKRHTTARLSARTGSLPLRSGGRYLIVGGAGGLGRVVAEHLLRAYDARVLLTGRRDEERLPAGILDRLRDAGGRLAYLSADVTDPADAHAAVRRMHEEYGGVDGVLHTAFVLADRTIAQSDDETFDAAFAPRTRGTVALADALTAEDLDFFALFSSAVAHTGNPGQSNYTAGSTFLSAYGAYLADRLHWPVTVFDWGYWGDEGAVATPEHRARLARWGVRPLSAAEGLRAFRQVLGSGLTQVAPLRADTTELARVTPLHPGDRLRRTDDGVNTLRAPVAALDSALRAAGEPYAPDYLDAVDGYARLAVLDALRGAVPALTGGEGRGERELAADLALRDDRRPLFDALLAALTAGGLVAADDGRYRVTTDRAEPGRRSTARGRLTDRFVRLGPTLDLVDECAAALPDVLAGRRSGLEVLFPGGSDHRMAALYADDPRTRHFNDLTATAVRAAVADRVATEPGRRVRILEIGAGTGATTRAVLDAMDTLGIQRGLVSYDVTDISPSLVAAARGRLADGRPDMVFRTLDICGDLSGQGFDEDRYDIVVATNVLHATGDIRRTLAHTARLTAVGGMLAVNEATRVLDAVTPVFGLTDGWWSARDPELRLPHGPLLASGTWRALLAEAGFEQSRAFGVQGWSDEQAGQCLFVARRGAWSISAEPTVEHPRARSARPPGRPVPAPESAGPADDLVARTTSHLRDLFADLLGMPPGELDVSAPLVSFGTDSLTVMEAVGRLEQEIGTVPRELLATGESVATVARTLTQARAPELAAALPALPGTPGSTGHIQPSAPRPVPEAVPAGPAPAPIAPLGDGEPIAVVGIAGRYPGSGDLDTLWGHLVAGRRLITREPPGRRQQSGPVLSAGEQSWGGFLDDVDRFDPLLFRIAPREAERMDPAERLFLETAWEALEDAALPPARLRERSADRGEATGVFVGLMHHQYALLGADERARGNDVRALSAGWSVANRVSHTFGLTGPSMAVDTACSSALTALHLAVQSLRAGECGTALVGGVNLILHPSHHADLAAARMLSPGGAPRVFDTAADGIVTGEGVGALVVKRLSDAVRDGDRVHARILGSAVNADGPTDAYAVPRVEAQVELIARALRAAGVDARSVQYVEAQATGSPVGDPVELAALRRAYGVRAGGHHLRLGSVKPNTGHLEAASGMVQLAKVVLQLRHRTLAPTEGIDGSPTADGFEVPREPVPWPEQASGEPRRAAVSSFGAGGANAHVIVEEEPAATAPPGDGTSPPRALLLSARRPEILRAHAGRIAAFLRGSGASLDPRDVTHTLRVGREPLPARFGAVVRSLDDIVSVLDACAAAGPHPLLVESGTGGDRDEDGDHPAAVVRRWVDGSDTQADRAPEPGARVVSLPHYPFAAGRYWLRTSGTSTDDGPVPPVRRAGPSTPPASSVSSVPEPAATGVRPSEELSVPRTHPVPGDDNRPPAVVTMQRTVTEAICDLLGVAPSDIDPGDHLSDFGLDSVTMVQLADRLATVTGTDLTPPVLYGCRDMAALVDHLVAATDGLATVGPAGDNSPSSAAPAPAAGPAPSQAASRPEPATEPVTEAVTEAEPALVPTAFGALDEPVAVVGMAGAFPGSPDLDTFWDNLVQGRDLISEAPADRFGADARAFRGGFLDGVDRFDADFFQISPREARVMDPQHRLFLQTVWSAVEDSGHDPLDLAGTACGVFVGVASSEYGELAQERGADLDGQLMTGNDHSVLANRVSFLLDLRGPSEPVDTACSSSLVAVHRAVRALQTGECASAIAGGVNVIVAPTGFEAFGRSGMLAQDGRCKSFDHRADGYVRGEGVGAVLLKPLSRALADGDHIHGVIAGSATNHGGRAASLTAPNPAAQAEVISRAQRRAGARPETIGYVEAHGTGTALGDPIEVTGLRTAFEPPAGSPTDGTSRQYCGLGSVKTNVGHLETAAGMAGLFKVLLALRHEMLPPTLHVERVNPLIKLADSPFHLVTSARPWFPVVDGATGTPLPRRAGVSSFGFGGTNAHLVVEEAPRPVRAVPRQAEGGDHLFVLSARDEDRLDAVARRLLDRIERWERDGRLHTVAPSDVARTLQTGRRHFAARLAVVAPSLVRVAEALRARVEDDGPRPAPGGRDGGRSRYDDGDVREALRRAAEGDLARLAGLWEAGTDVDFAILRAGTAGSRVPLPTYPFAADRYWLPDAPVPVSEAPAAPIASAVARPPHDPPPPPAPSAPAPLAARTPDADSALRGHVRAAVADGIGIPAGSVDPTRDFASYGVDSIGAMRIMQTVQNRYGDHIPMAAILEHPSVDRLVTHLERHFVLPDEVPTSLDRRDGAGPAAPARLPAPPVTPRPRLVPFTADGPGTPVYCVFGDTGELTWLMRLTGQLGKAGPVIGVEAPGFREGATPVGDIDVLAGLCAEAVAAAHPGGACRIAGQGVAGYVAAQTARLLHDRGLPVEELLLIGTPAPGERPRNETWTASLAEVAATLAGVWGAGRPAHAADPAGGPEGEALARVCASLAVHAPLDTEALSARLELGTRWRSALVTAAASHRLPPIGGPERTTVVRAAAPGGAPGDYHRWIAPPPEIVDIDIEPWRLLSAGQAGRTAGRTPARPITPRSPAASPVVAINRHGDSRRSIWAHNLYGEVSYAIYLSRHLGPHTPVIGLEQIGAAAADGEPRRYDSVEDMAAHYVGELRNHFPGEPYLLGGCSFGGVLAYEMARQLQLAGEEVSHLIAIDPIMPGTEAWDSVDWGTVTEMEAEAFSLVMLGNAMCQRWGVGEQIRLDSLTGLGLAAQLDLVARHIHDRSAAHPDREMIERQILVRHELMLHNGDLLQAYRPEALRSAVPTTLFHATEGFLAPGNSNDLPAVPRTSADRSNGLAEFVGPHLTIHEMRADHHTIAHDENLARIAGMLSPVLNTRTFPSSLFPASLSPAGPDATR